MGDDFWVVELAIKPGELASFRALMSDMVTAIETNEPGTLNYELFISEDERTCHIYERYRDAEAVRAHLANFSQGFADRFAAAVEVTRFTVYGDPDDEVREAVSDFGVVYMAPIGGVTR
jgi:quinol monooxygenase YgiN